MKKSGFWKNYGFLILMLTGIVAGCVVGAIWPAVKDASGEVIVKGATVLEPLGTVFLNLMFCIAVPTVFCSISSSIANMQSAKRAGKIMGVTIATFLTTAAIAAVIMYVTVLLIPPVTGEYAMIEGEVGGTLGVGLGTFRPVKEDDIEQHDMHSEYCVIPPETATLINETKANSGRVICVGTTSCRTLESWAQEDGHMEPSAGWTSIYIYPGYRFKVMDALVTNFHLPQSTLIMLVSALAGREHVLHAYEEAVKERYRFFSFGDAMFIS